MTTPTLTPMRERLREDYHWTPRQRQVLDMLAADKTNGEIAERLEVSLAGAKWHVSEIMSKLGAESREEAAEYWRRYNGMRPRFSRVFRGIVGATALKWTAAAIGVIAVGGGVVAILALAQDDDEPPADDQATQVTPTAVPTAGGANRTGIAGVDAVIDAVMSREHDQVIALLALEQVPCTSDPNEQPLSPPCLPDAEGTLREAFPISGCESGWAPGQFPWVDSLLMREPEVFAVFRQDAVTADPPHGLPSGEYVIVWNYGAVDSTGVALEVTDGRIVRETGACGPYPYNLTQDVSQTDYILLPANGIPTPPPPARVRHLGDTANDRLIDAMVAGDWETLAGAFELYPEPCTTATERGVGSPPACPPGVPDGGTVNTTRITACETTRSQNPVEELDWLFEPMFAFGHEVYAAFPPDQPEYVGGVPGGDVVVVLQRIGSTEGSAWHLSAGKIVGLRTGCGEQAAEFAEGIPDSGFVLPPAQ
jgi:DNA-binding CsgD family transcriptional regulator